MADPLVTLYCVVHGPIYERYAATLIPQAEQFFLPDVAEVVVLPGNGGWPHGSASRYQVALDHQDQIRGEWVFQIDADMRIEQPVGHEILGEGLTVTTHPGYPEGTSPDICPYERRPESRACVPLGTGTRYHPGAFVGGKRQAFLDMCRTTMGWYADDQARGITPEWYEEAYLNRYLVDHPPAVVLDRRYCYWDFWGPHPTDRIVVHLDKTAEEFEQRG